MELGSYNSWFLHSNNFYVGKKPAIILHRQLCCGSRERTWLVFKLPGRTESSKMLGLCIFVILAIPWRTRIDAYLCFGLLKLQQLPWEQLPEDMKRHKSLFCLVFQVQTCKEKSVRSLADYRFHIQWKRSISDHT